MFWDGFCRVDTGTRYAGREALLSHYRGTNILITQIDAGNLKYSKKPSDNSYFIIFVNVDQLKKRAERFGMNVSSVSQKMEEDEKLKKRKERFGIQTASGTVGSADTEAKKVKRAARFGIV